MTTQTAITTEARRLCRELNYARRTNHGAGAVHYIYRDGNVGFAGNVSLRAMDMDAAYAAAGFDLEWDYELPSVTARESFVDGTPAYTTRVRWQNQRKYTEREAQSMLDIVDAHRRSL